jgi:hypothetical protein
MARTAWTSYVSNQDTTGFRAWGSEFAAKMAAVGLTQTSDTGQINWSTVNRPGAANTEAGYEIWRFNDSLQATAPIYFRVGYGSGGIAADRPRIQITVGTGSNGSGTITGTALTIARSVADGGDSATAGRQSFMCYKPERGFFGFNWKAGANCNGSFFICRTVDANGDPTVTGALITWSTAQQALRFAATAVAYTAITGNRSCLIPMAESSGIVNGVPQVYMHFTITPQVSPLNQILTVFEAEYGQGTTFEATPIGVTSRTYIALGANSQSAEAVRGVSGVDMAMLWEA